MAPILATATGLAPPPSASGALERLRRELCTVDVACVRDVLAAAGGDSCFCEEQVDLHHWIEPLNNLDGILRSLMEAHPQMLLLPPVPRVSKLFQAPDLKPAASLAETAAVPPDAIATTVAILSFWAALLQSSTCKFLFNSVEECCDLLGAASDDLVDAALAALRALALPPALHKQQAPESALHNHHHQGTALSATAHPACLTRLTALARGHTSRATGLGLYQLLTAPRPPAPAVHFSYYASNSDAVEAPVDGEQCLQEIVLEEQEILATPDESSAANEGTGTKKRRRVTAHPTTGDNNTELTRSTAELFFLTLSKAKGKLHSERLFALLADIRWARSKPVAGVNRRLSALVCILHSHPSQDVMNGYFAAQPELGMEVVDLLRPTVSANAVSSAAAAQLASCSNRLQQDGISGLADTQVVPYSTRMLALEVLTALVSRRDGSSGALSGSMRLSNVLLDLGVGKGQYLGLLPTLIRYSLASLGNPLANREDVELDSQNEASVVTSGLQLGLAFVEATIPPQPPRILQVRQALAMIDNVLTLTSAVIAAPSGASSLIDCGLIPALLTTISTDTAATFRLIMRDEPGISTNDAYYIRAQLRCITAQVIQILEGAVVSSNSALASFHDLNGVDVLTDRFGREISLIHGTKTAHQEAASDPMELDSPDHALTIGTTDTGYGLRISPAQRVLLFSIVTCLTVVCHQENATSTTALPSGGSQLRKPEVTSAVVLILDRVDSFGGHLASLVATLLSDIMNNDPQIVHYVHESGIAKAFLSMVAGKRVGECFEPKIPPIAELIMAIPNVLAALALTESGAKAVKEAAPFPSLLRLFYHPDFAMPNSRCLLNDMTAIVGTGLDEIMRHVESLKTDILMAINDAIRNVIKLADEISSRESRCEQSSEQGIEDERTCLIQYVLNLSQLLEQILHNEDHCEPFVEAGGLDGLLQLFPASMPGGIQLLTHISSSSSLAISTVHHSTIEDTLMLVIKCILLRYNPFKLVQKICDTVFKRIDVLEASCIDLFGENIYFSLDKIQRVPFYKLESTSLRQVILLADFLKNVALLHWTTNILTVTIKSLCQRSQETDTDGWSASEQEWKKYLMSSSFASLTSRLADFHYASLFEVCRVRSEKDFEDAERARQTTRIQNLMYRLRIVCPEGAVVRDGIEIDSSASLGSMEMGEIVLAYDRCINMSGIMRWRTNRGWISDMTRGHGREPIVEVLGVMENPVEDSSAVLEMADDKRIEAVIPDLRVVALGILARGQASFRDLFTELSKFSVHAIRSVPVRTIGFEEGDVGYHVAVILRVLGSNLVKGMNIHYIRREMFPVVGEDNSPNEMSISSSGIVMYYGAMMHLIQSSLFDDRRERRLVNLALLVDLISADPYAKSLISGLTEDAAPTLSACDEIGIFGMCSFAFDQELRILSDQSQRPLTNHYIQQRRSIDRSVAASFPSLLSLLRHFISASMSSSPMASVMSRMKWTEIPKLIGKTELDAILVSNTGNDGFFEPERFVKCLYLGQSRLLRQALQSDKLISVPAHLMHPLVSAICDLINVLSDATKAKVSSSSRTLRNDNAFSLSEYFRVRRQSSIASGQEEEFEPNESSIALLMEMGFTRERAVDALEVTRSNRVEVAMEYALTHPPPSPETVERRRLEREEHRRVRNSRESETQASSVAAAAGETESGINQDRADETAMDESAELVEQGQKVGQAAEAVEEDGIIIGCKTEIDFWLELAPTVVCRILAGVDDLVQQTTIDCSSGDAEIEGVTVVLSSLLLSLCNRFPEKCPNLLFNVFDLLKEEIGDLSVITSHKEARIAAFCHAALLCTRAVPRSRIFILHNNLLAHLLNLIKDASGAIVSGRAYPMWLVPALLLVDVMAQPVVGFMDEEIIKSMLQDNLVDENSELGRVRKEHKLLTQQLDRTTRKFFSALQSNSDLERGGAREPNQSSSPESATSEDGAFESPKLEPHVPAYLPLIPLDLLERSVEICRALLDTDNASEKRVEPPPAVAHATLLLFLNLLRMPNVPSCSRNKGTIEAILSLPGSSKFKENDILVALVLRSYLEDDATLQATMETEMRGALAKLQAKKRHLSSSDQDVEISLEVFVDSVKPLLCRDPIAFIKAMALAVKIIFDSDDEDGPFVVSLSNEERLKNQTIIATFDASNQSSPGAIHAQNALKTRGRSPHHKKEKERRSLSSSKKSMKKEKQAVPMTSSSHADVGGTESSSTQVMSLLMNSVFSMVLNNSNDYCMIVHGPDTVESVHGRICLNKSSASDSLSTECDKEFLWLGNLLDIMTELILAIPACASAVHNYRPSRIKDKALRMALSSQMRHSLSGCPNPPKTFVNFLLHVILPQDRWSIRNDGELWDKGKSHNRDQTERRRARKIKAYRMTKSSQAAARMLLVLAARPGEGRKRVITDLAFALSGGRFGHGSTYLPDSSSLTMFHARELLALQAWGELLTGLVAPRHSGKSVSSIGSLSIDNIRVMLDVGVVHSLLYALHRVELVHPMASVSCAHLLQPFECLTRSAVSDNVRALIEKEKNFNAKGVETKATTSITGSEGHATSKDILFMDTADEPVNMGNDDNEEDSVVISSSSDDSESTNDEEEEEEESENSDMDEVDSIDEDEGDDEEMESSEGDDDVHDEDHDQWNVDEEEDVRVDNDDMQPDLELADEEVIERLDQSLDDGWTRIESSGLGDHRGVSVSGTTGARMRGFVDAAEAMIGSLLRHGEISSEAMDEIGETLGIRLGASQGHSLQSMMFGGELNMISSVNPPGQQSVRVLRAADSAEEGRRRELITSLPQIQQRTQPNDTYSSFGGRRHCDLNSMEYIFGGPTATAADRHYSLVSVDDSEVDQRNYPSLTQLDLQLFPEGPGLVTGSRTSLSLHPLLWSFNLPPVNSVVSDLESHGAAAVHEQSTSRRPGEGTSLGTGGLIVSMTNGNIIRSFARSHSGALVASGANGRSIGQPTGWMNDNNLTDPNVQRFAAAFERRIASTMRRPASADTANVATETGSPPVGQTPLQDETVPAAEADTTDNTNDGDMVASSLAEGLRLSPGSEMGTVMAYVADGLDPVPGSEAHESNPVFEANESQPHEDPIDDSILMEVNAEVPLPEARLPNSTENPTDSSNATTEQDNTALVCPPDVDVEVFNSLPVEMQRECISQYNATRELAIDVEGSSLDPDVLAALPEDVRREVIEQERQERRMREQDQAPADPSHAAEMDNASFIASLAPQLREEILMTADEEFLNSLPPGLIAEAQLLRERAAIHHRRVFNESAETEEQPPALAASSQRTNQIPQIAEQSSSRRNKRYGKIKIEVDRPDVIYLPTSLSNPFGRSSIAMFIQLMYLLSPVRPSRLLQRVFYNIFSDSKIRSIATKAFIKLLHGDGEGCRLCVESLRGIYGGSDDWRDAMDKLFPVKSFPPSRLLGSIPEVVNDESNNDSSTALKKRSWPNAAATIAANLPPFIGPDNVVPPVVSVRVIDTMLQLCKASPRYCVHLLSGKSKPTATTDETTDYESLLDLLAMPMFTRSSTNLDQLLSLLEAAAAPLSFIPKNGDEEEELSQKEIDSASSSGKEWVDIPRVAISQPRLQLLCSILRMETCRESSFTKVNTIVRRLCRVETNRGVVLGELASVAHALGADAVRDLRALKIRMNSAASHHHREISNVEEGQNHSASVHEKLGHVASSVTLSTSSSELKLLRVLQTLQSLCGENWDESGNRKSDNSILVTEELVHLFKQLDFSYLWDELSSCLAIVQVLEGVKAFEDEERMKSEAIDAGDDVSGEGDDQQKRQRKKLRNSAAGLLTRFLPSIEAFFVANASAMRGKGKVEDTDTGATQDIHLDNLVDGQRVIMFVATNKVLLNALLRNNSGLIDKGLRALVQVPRCRSFLDFDVKRQWFKAQVRRLRQQASRRHGSLRLQIRRKYVFEDAYHQLRLRNAEEMRGRLHVTFRNEEGVDAGGLSREFFAILAKEMFNPNYALFTSTEDGCTFQPNPNSSINPDHLSYFRFVGRIVGKALADGYLLDAHFTRSLYKHMLGLTPTYHDMEAIDPDYYRNLKTILEFNLADIGLDLTFSIEDHSFGRSQTIDLIPQGRRTPVTDDTKEEYVRLVCQHRMTTAIQSQIRAYLDGFHEMVGPGLIAVFSPRELELLISGLPDIDAADLKAHTDYVGWKVTDHEIVWFWNILFSLSRNERAAFLQFVTGSSKVPLGGFGELQGMRGNQKFSIHKVANKKGALMSAHTCFNQLDLPTYDSEEEMRSKLLFAINEGGGAFLFA